MTRRSNDALKLTVVPLLAASFLTGCGDDEEQAYCVDENDEVVENRYCDDEYNGGVVGPYFWAFTGGTTYKLREKVTTGDRIRASDRAALASRGGFGSSSSGEGTGRTITRSSGGG